MAHIANDEWKEAPTPFYAISDQFKEWFGYNILNAEIGSLL